MTPVLKVLTANRLEDGVAVWFGKGRVWVERVEDAWAVAPDAASPLETAAGEAIAAARHNDVVLIDVEDTVHGLRPLKLRERIRAAGPTIRQDLGKQAGPIAARAA